MFRPSSGKFYNKTYLEALEEQRHCSHDHNEEVNPQIDVDIIHQFGPYNQVPNRRHVKPYMHGQGPSGKPYPHPRGRMFVRSSGKIHHRSYYEASASWSTHPYRKDDWRGRKKVESQQTTQTQQVIISY